MGSGCLEVYVCMATRDDVSIFEKHTGVGRGRGWDVPKSMSREAAEVKDIGAE